MKVKSFTYGHNIEPTISQRWEGETWYFPENLYVLSVIEPGWQAIAIAMLHALPMCQVTPLADCLVIVSDRPLKRWVKGTSKMSPLPFSALSEYIYVMCIRPLYIFHSFSAGIDFRRQILTSKVDPRTERVKAQDWIIVDWDSFWWMHGLFSN